MSWWYVLPIIIMMTIWVMIMSIMRIVCHDDIFCHRGARKEEDDRPRDSSSWKRDWGLISIWFECALERDSWKSWKRDWGFWSKLWNHSNYLQQIVVTTFTSSYIDSPNQPIIESPTLTFLVSGEQDENCEVGQGFADKPTHLAWGETKPIIRIILTYLVWQVDTYCGARIQSHHNYIDQEKQNNLGGERCEPESGGKRIWASSLETDWH